MSDQHGDVALAAATQRDIGRLEGRMEEHFTWLRQEMADIKAGRQRDEARHRKIEGRVTGLESREQQREEQLAQSGEQRERRLSRRPAWVGNIIGGMAVIMSAISLWASFFRMGGHHGQP